MLESSYRRNFNTSFVEIFRNDSIKRTNSVESHIEGINEQKKLRVH